MERARRGAGQGSRERRQGARRGGGARPRGGSRRAGAPDGRLEVGTPLEIRVPSGHAFFDYAAKYSRPATIYDIPARLEPAIIEELRDCAVRAFRALDCRGLLRVDFLLRYGTQPVVNEVNTFPGFTAVSQYPQVFRAAGLDYPALLDVLIATAIARGGQRKALRAASWL